jgi:hypothetical protein
MEERLTKSALREKLSLPLFKLVCKSSKALFKSLKESCELTRMYLKRPQQLRKRHWSLL